MSVSSGHCLKMFHEITDLAMRVGLSQGTAQPLGASVVTACAACWTSTASFNITVSIPTSYVSKDREPYSVSPGNGTFQ